MDQAQEQQETEIGDSVLYVMPHNGAIRPAVVVQVWPGTKVNLQVFTDGGNDGEPNNVRWVTSVQHDRTKQPGTFHHPYYYVPEADDVAPV